MHTCQCENMKISNQSRSHIIKQESVLKRPMKPSCTALSCRVFYPVLPVGASNQNQIQVANTVNMQVVLKATIVLHGQQRALNAYTNWAMLTTLCNDLAKTSDVIHTKENNPRPEVRSSSQF
jgi:hypothetical protein